MGIDVPSEYCLIGSKIHVELSELRLIGPPHIVRNGSKRIGKSDSKLRAGIDIFIWGQKLRYISLDGSLTCLVRIYISSNESEHSQIIDGEDGRVVK